MEPATALAFCLAKQSLQNQLPPSASQHLKAHFNTAENILSKDDTPYTHWRQKIRVLPQTQQLIPTERRCPGSEYCVYRLAGESPF